MTFLLIQLFLQTLDSFHLCLCYFSFAVLLPRLFYSFILPKDLALARILVTSVLRTAELIAIKWVPGS